MTAQAGRGGGRGRGWAEAGGESEVSIFLSLYKQQFDVQRTLVASSTQNRHRQGGWGSGTEWG